MRIINMQLLLVMGSILLLLPPRATAALADRSTSVSQPAKMEDDPDYKPLSELGATVKGVRFELVRRDRHHVDIVVHLKGKVLTMPDQKVFQREKADVAVYEPGQTNKGYDYFLSPDHNWLFVERGVFHRYNVGFLYHRISPTRMVAVRPGDKFYDAALRYYCTVRHKSYFKLGGGARNMRFTRWDEKHHRVLFWIYAASDWYGEKKRGNIKAYFHTSYDLKRGNFRILKEETDL